jgi:acetyl/propionyl-CoA carboxylase alpha subunit
MNARLQVEHPITEAVAGVDLVREQLAIAAGAPLALTQAGVTPRGHAIEVRVYAEDAERGFLPSTGRLTAFVVPEGPGIRNDVGVEAGSVVSVDYDPMLGKLIAYDRTRADCIERLGAALGDYIVGGVTTNIPFLRWLIADDAFARGETTTGFIEQRFTPERLSAGGDDTLARLAAAGALQDLPASSAPDAWHRAGPWRHSTQTRIVTFAGEGDTAVEVERVPGGWRCRAGGREALVNRAGGAWTIETAGKTARFAAWTTRKGIAVSVGGRVIEFAVRRAPSTDDVARGAHGGRAGKGSVEAPMSGKVVKVASKAGDRVAARDVLVVMEAMKMEHTIVAPYDGQVLSVNVSAGDTVGAGDVLAEIEAAT